MRTIERSSAFRKDYKRESRSHGQALDGMLTPILMTLANDMPLEPKHRDHALGGHWADYRECHIKPDLLLIYSLSGKDTLRLARLGSHSELFG